MASGSGCAVWGLAPCCVANVRALSVVMCPSWRMAAGQGRAVWGILSFGAWQKAPASAGAGCQAGRGRRGPLPLLAGLCFCISGWHAADSLQAFRWLQEGKALPSWPLFGGLWREWGPPPRGAPCEAASPSGLLGAHFNCLPRFSYGGSWKMSPRDAFGSLRGVEFCPMRETAVSTCPPRGNLVDGLPRAPTWLQEQFDFSCYKIICIFRTLQV